MSFGAQMRVERLCGGSTLAFAGGFEQGGIGGRAGVTFAW